MRSNKIARLTVVLVVALFSLACAMIGPSKTPTATPVEPTSPPKTITKSEATAKPAETAPASAEPGAATNLDDAQKAVIRIVAEGTYEYPDFTKVSELGSGSGFLISPDGIAVTNNHVVTGAARIKVFFSDNQKAYNARVLGRSECSDLAVIQVDGQNFPYLKWYQDKPKLGLKVYSMGYPLGDPNFTRHAGAVSKEQADGNTSWTAVDTVIEHDAIINPGNSGGPLVTEDGQVVGINYASAGQYNQYYAIPASAATNVVKDLQKGNNVTSLGINGEAMVNKDRTLSGIWVYSVQSGSPADKAGIQPGDFMLELEGIALGRDGTMTDYCDVLRTHKDTDTLGVKVVRLKSSEILEGQINGRELKTTQPLGQSGGSTTPQAEATTEKPAFFTEEFDSNLPDWSYFHFGKDNAKYSLTTDNSRLTFDIQDPNTYVYLLYDPYTYTDVRLDAAVLNQAGTNNNAFSLVCRYTKDGWYEFNVSSGGLWTIMRFDSSTNKYTLLYNGGAQNINTGQDRNIFGLECNSSEISTFINNKQMKTVTDKHYSEGQVGISVSSFDDAPVKVSFDTLVISQP